MKTKLLLTLVFLSIMTVQLACQFGSRAVSPTSAPSDPDTSTQNLPASGADLSNPAIGLDGLSSYHQNLSIELRGTLLGATYEEGLHLERAVRGGDESLLVNSFSSPTGSLYLFDARLDNYHYSQSQVNGACRAEPLAEAQDSGPNPAVRLPAVFGMQEAGREPLGGLTAVSYIFDEKSLSNRDGAVKKAFGKVLLAENSGLLLRYELTVELATDDFSGSRTYIYALDQIAADQPVRLPSACPPVLSDVPVLEGAQDVTNLPGFQRYTAPTQRSQAVAFFFDELTTLGWQALPGAAPDQADLDSPVTVLSFAQSYLDGGRVLVIQLSESGMGLQVVAQSTLTQSPVQFGVSGVPSAEKPPAESEPTTAPAILPADLPAYPEAKVVVQTDSILILTVEGPLADVIDFYKREMDSAGWTLKEDISGTTIFMYGRASETLVIAVSEQDGAIQVMITATE